MPDQPLPPSPGHTQTDVREPGGRTDAPRPRDLGHYRLLRLLGEGGMGEVWLADQLEPVLRQVAVKVIKAGMDTRRVVARFEAERQALALMSHPAIASVLDGGSTPEGRPYFVMEYIEGVSLTEHCDRQRLSTEARLELLIEVCAGVQHAHQKAIVHRDLKPSNILVTQADGRAQPKIIDFGIAKAIGEAGELESRHTALGAVIGTAAYMSPEQADPAARDVDTRTDVYSLGVILYELLTGELPFGGGTGPPSQEDQRRKLSGESPPRPSARLLATPGTGEAARARGTDPGALRRLLEGDLDAIALKALERDRARRYGTPTELAADLQRYLRREPVLAQAPSAAYRARKYVERHRTAVTAAAALVVALVGGVVVSAWQAQRARAAERRAEAEAAVARATSDFLENDLLGQADVARQAGERPDPDLKVRTLLDRAAARVEGSFEGQPALEGSLRATIGDAYLGLGLLAEARTQLDRAVAVSEGVLGPDAPPTLKARAALARLALAQSKPAEAEALSLDTLERLRRVLGPEHPDTLQSLVVLASARYAQGHYPEAEAGLTQALELQRRVLGPEHRETLYTMMKLGSTYSVQSRQPEAEALFRQTLELQRRVLGPEHPDTLRTANSLGTVCMYQEEYAAAEAVLAPLVAIERRVLGPQHPQTLLSLMSLGALYHDTGKLAQAEAAMVEASAIQRQVLGPAHLETLGGLLSLGELYCTEGRYQEAESTLAGALESLRREKPSSMYLLYAMALMADVHAAEGQFAQAEALGEDALAAWRRTKGPEHRDLLLELVSQALRADLPLGKYARARARLAEALEAQRRTLGPEHRETLVTLDTLARLARAEGRYGEARVQYADVLERRRRTLGEDNLSVLESEEGLALTDFLDGQREAAAARLGQVLEARRRRQGTRIPAALQTLADQAMALESTGSFAAAEPLAREALAGERAVRPEHWRRFFAQSVLGAALWGQRRHSEAAPLLREGVAGLEARREQVGVPDRFRVERARAWLARLR